MTEIKAPKKLIEVALPLDDINKASVREKSIRHGHPSTLHLWWARRPLATARAVLFAQLVNDPGYERALGRGVNKEKAEIERERLFGIIRKLVLWENTNNEAVLAEAREEIWKSWRETCALNKNHPQAAELFNPEKLPAFHDPFAGGGSIPLEAQRLGLEAYASDLNPVAVLINKAMIEIPPKFAGRPPVNPESLKQRRLDEWQGAKGLAEDVRYYGKWIRDEAEKRIGHIYPKVVITEKMAKDRPDLKPYIGRELTVIAWLWARTVRSPNPAFANIEVPLAASFWLSTKKGKETWVEPVISPDGKGYSFVVRVGGEPAIEETMNRKGGICIMSKMPMPFPFIRVEAQAGRMGARLMAIVAEGDRGRVYLSPSPEIEAITQHVKNIDAPETRLPEHALGFRVQQYGMRKWSDLFTSRQLVALTTFADLVGEVREKAQQDAVAAGMTNDGRGLDAGGSGAAAYADAVSVYLAFGLNRMTNSFCTITRWSAQRNQTLTAFARQAIPMTWDYPEVNPFAGAAGDFCVSVEGAINGIPSIQNQPGRAIQADSVTQSKSKDKVVSTDPPYYDNIGYADLSDFFYVWLRRTMKSIYPKLFATLAVPKTEELIASPYRHGSKQAAETFFLTGMTKTISQIAEQSHPAFPVTIYYAFKQSETKETETVSTGWETFLDAILTAGLDITGTWPMHTEREVRSVSLGSNALASSIILVCRRRLDDAPIASRKEFIQTLKAELPEALAAMTLGETTPIAPVDLAQAAIGPGMAVFSRYKAVLEADGTPMPIRTALTLINKALDDYFAEAEGDLDADTRFAIAWFDEFGWAAGAFGQADVLARAKGTSVEGVREAGVIEASGGKVRLLRATEYDADWDPATDSRLAIWEALHHLSQALQSGGESEAGALLVALGAKAAPVRQLAYRLYTLCERKGWAEDARTYNELITSWQAVEAVSHDIATGSHGPQATLTNFGD